MERSSAEPGLTVAASGLTPARRISPRTSAAWAGLCRVMTTPSAPARAVRPDRCRYALCSAGGSAWITKPMPSTWMPRAAMSVATRTRAAPEANDARFRSLGTLAEVAVQLHHGYAMP